MTKTAIVLAALLGSVALPAAAQQITGASIGGSYGVLFNDDNTETLSFSGGVDVAVAPSITVGASLASFSSDILDDDVLHATVRCTYMFSPYFGAGVFFAFDDVGSETIESFGIETGYGSENGRFEFYVAGVDGFNPVSSVDVSTAGLSFALNLTDEWAFSAGVDGITQESGSLSSTVSAGYLGAEYKVAGGPVVFVDVGQVSFETNIGSAFVPSSSEEDFVRIGAKLNIGRGNGELFGNRSPFLGYGF